MKIKNAFLLTLGLFLLGVVGFSAAASAITGAGGQVSVKGQITFYEGTTESSTIESSTTETSTSTSSSEVPGESSSTSDSSSEAAANSGSATKPQGSYPSTGEMIRNYSFAGVGAILLFVLILWNRRKKKEEEQI